MPDETSIQCRHHIALFTKDQLIAAFFFVINSTQNAVIKFDPRQNPPYVFFGFETEDGARSAFQDHIAISKANGWKLVFEGEPNNARLS